MTGFAGMAFMGTALGAMPKPKQGGKRLNSFLCFTDSALPLADRLSWLVAPANSLPQSRHPKG